MRQTRILLIDDDLKQLFVTKAQLQHQHTSLDVEIARSQEEGVEKLRFKSYDCIIHSLGEEEGAEGLSLSRSLRNLHIDTPVILLAPEHFVALQDSGITRLIHRSTGNEHVASLSKTIEEVIEQNPSHRRGYSLEMDRASETELVLARYRTAFEGSDTMMMIVSPDGLTLERCSPALERMLKPRDASDEFQNIPLVMLTNRPERPRFRSFIRDIIRDNKKTAVFSFLRSGGPPLKLEIHGVPVQHRGKNIAIVLYASEVTD